MNALVEVNYNQNLVLFNGILEIGPTDFGNRLETRLRDGLDFFSGQLRRLEECNHFGYGTL